MTDDDSLEAAVAAFVDEADTALAEYDQGYADADATIRRLRPHVERLAAVHEAGTDDGA